jgi:4,5-dihydroxyphthalate decarboxylase
VRALADGTVRADGIDLNVIELPVEETFFRMARHREFDVAEMSLSSYMVSLSRPDSPFIALPVFPSRCFRHSCIYVHADAGITEPQHLVGKRIGTPEYQMTAPVWIRGILAEHHGVPVHTQDYWCGGEEEPGRIEKIPLTLPPQIRIHPIEPHQTLSQMLEAGEIDALYTARAPSTFQRGSGKVRRLFQEHVAVERAYYRQTGIFPIMHTVVMRRDVYAANRWIAQSLTKAFAAAQRLAYADLHETAALKAMLPWLNAHVEDAEAEFGTDWWPYGLEPNRHTLATFVRYHHEQGLSGRLLTPDELFAPEALEAFRI